MLLTMAKTAVHQRASRFYTNQHLTLPLLLPIIEKEPMIVAPREVGKNKAESRKMHNLKGNLPPHDNTKDLLSLVEPGEDHGWAPFPVK